MTGNRMSAESRQISDEMFDALAEGYGGSEAVSVLRVAEYSKHLLMLRGVVEEAGKADADHAQLAVDGYEVLTAVRRADPAAARDVIGYPAVGAWLLRVLRGLMSKVPASTPEPAGLGALAAAAAIRAGVTARVQVRSVAGAVHLPSLGVAVVDAPVATANISAGAAEIRTTDRVIRISGDPGSRSPGWLSLQSIRGDQFNVIVDDLHPFRMPAITGATAHLGNAEMTSWRRSIREGWRLLAARHPDTADEVQAGIRVLVPLNSPPYGQVSSSSPETFGAVALSLPPDPYTCAVTLAHELQHLKLSALLGIRPLTFPNDDLRYYAPWRSDPRPLEGLLQGTYAHLAICGFWERERHFACGEVAARADREFALWRIGIGRAIDALLKSKQLTQYGVRFVEGMARTASAWQDEPVPRTAQQYAVREARDHLVRWEQTNGPPVL
jgi:uncharacterized protein